MNIKQYQREAAKTAIYPQEHKVTYPLFGLVGEVGEFANKFKKVLRDGTPLDMDAIQGELGDILWYLSALAGDLGLSLDEVAYENIAKLKDRQERGVIGGSGDKR